MINKFGLIIGVFLSVLVMGWLFDKWSDSKTVSQDKVATESVSSPSEKTLNNDSVTINDPKLNNMNNISAAAPSIDSDRKNNEVVVNANADSVYSTGIAQDKLDPIKLEQRKQIYNDINQVMDGMSVGIEPDLNQVQTISEKLVALTQEGYIPYEDALNTFEYLQKTIPSMDKQFNYYSRQIEGVEGLEDSAN